MNGKTRLLAIDDDQNSAELVARIATRSGYQAMASTAPADVPSLVESWKPDVLSLDICMPDVDAIELFAILHKVQFKGRIIVISGQTDAMRDAAGKLASVQGVSVAGNFSKPVDIHELRELLNTLRTPN